MSLCCCLPIKVQKSASCYAGDESPLMQHRLENNQCKGEEIGTGKREKKIRVEIGCRAGPVQLAHQWDATE
jgi:hypothetical protein